MDLRVGGQHGLDIEFQDSQGYLMRPCLKIVFLLLKNIKKNKCGSLHLCITAYDFYYAFL